MPGYVDKDIPGSDGGWDDGYPDDDLDPEGPSAADLDRFGDEFRPCPECGTDVYDQSPLCPRCGHAFSNQPAPQSVWLLITALVVVVALLFVFVIY